MPVTKPVILINGTPVYPRPEPTAALTEDEVEAMARTLTGDPEVARHWMDRPNVTLRGRTPRQAVQNGESQLAAGILRSF